MSVATAIFIFCWRHFGKQMDPILNSTFLLVIDCDASKFDPTISLTRLKTKTVCGKEGTYLKNYISKLMFLIRNVLVSACIAFTHANSRRIYSWQYDSPVHFVAGGIYSEPVVLLLLFLSYKTSPGFASGRYLLLLGAESFS